MQTFSLRGLCFKFLSVNFVQMETITESGFCLAHVSLAKSLIFPTIRNNYCIIYCNRIVICKMFLIFDNVRNEIDKLWIN